MVLKLNGGGGGSHATARGPGRRRRPTFTTVVPATDYTFDPGTNDDTIQITFPVFQQRYIRVRGMSRIGREVAEVPRIYAGAGHNVARGG